MKKQFFYAAFALALMASCTSEDKLSVDPVNPTPEADKTAIQLGVDFPSITASSRSTGPVGDVAGVNNQWNGQRLFIAMVDEAGNYAVEDKTVATESQVKVLTPEIYEYRAPKYVAPQYDNEGNLSNEDAISNKGNIRIYQSYDATNQNGVLKHVYYPVSDTYDFYGWHVDGDETGDNKGKNGTPNIAGGTAKVQGIVIDGNRDIMGARTKAYNQLNYGNLYGATLEDWIFSARSARSDVHPILEFKHQLARLKFFVRAGSKETAAKVWDGDSWEDRAIANGTHIDGSAINVTADPMKTGAMFVTALTVKDMTNKIDMDLNAVDATNQGQKCILTTPATGAATNATFSLGDKGTDGVIGALKAKAPMYPHGDANIPANDVNKNGTQIGESIMFFPNGTSKAQVSFDIALKQYLKQTTDETVTPNTSKYDYKTQNASLLIKAASIKMNDAYANATEFKAGYSYNVYITIYGFEEIVVTAELTPWEVGGDIDVDVEEEESQVPGEGEEDDEEEAEDVQVAFTMPAGVEAATITVQGMEPFAWTALNNKMTFAADAESVTATIAIEGYQAITKTFVPSEAATNGITVEQNELVANTPATPEKVAITFELPDGIDAASITIPGLSEAFAWSRGSNSSVEVPYGDEAITATIAIEGYVAITKEITPNDEATIEVTADEAADAKLHTLEFDVVPADQTTIIIQVKVEGAENFTTLEDGVRTYQAVKGTKIIYIVSDNEGRSTGEEEYTFSEVDGVIEIEMSTL